MPPSFGAVVGGVLAEALGTALGGVPRGVSGELSPEPSCELPGEVLCGAEVPGCSEPVPGGLAGSLVGTVEASEAGRA
ncbi:hypothetical protein G3I76_64190, partial [Streptomyces sp. SID11233]|nr:hypothetical protein [Streptomyces sp. SID11233]